MFFPNNVLFRFLFFLNDFVFITIKCSDFAYLYKHHNFACFSGFSTADVTPRLASGQKLVITGVQNVGDFALLWSDYDGEIICRQSSLTATDLGGGVWEFVPPSSIFATDLYVTLLVQSNQFDGRIFYVNRVLYKSGNGPIQDLYDGYSSYQSTVWFTDGDMPSFDTLYIDYAVTWEQQYYTALQTEIENVTTLYEQALDTIASYEAMENGVGALENTFGAVGRMLNIEVLPNITIGTIVSVPLILGVVFLILRLVRGE